MQPIVHQRSTLTAPMLWFSAYRWNKIGEGLRLFVVSEPAMRCLRAGPCLPVRLWVPVLLAALSVAVPMMFRITSFNTVAAPIRRFLLFTGLGQIVMVIVLYLSGDFPNHAMGGRYLMVPSVFAAVLLAMVTDAMIKKRRLNRFVIGGFLFIVVVNAIVTTQAEIITNKQIVSLQDVHDGRPVVTTAVKWGVLPMLIWDLDPDTPVYAAIGDALRHHPDPGVFMFPEICLVTRRSRYRFDPETSNIHMVFISRGYQSERCITHVRGEGTVVLLKRQGPIHPMGPDSGVIGSGSYVDIRCQSKLSFQHKHTGVTSGQPNTKQPHADSEPDDSICYPSQKRTP
ncbi:hypothetical protein JXA80_04015, partial [bacterium]|nr:hypothetical protein [candidate division CSSED10-310 bacterium]